MAIMNSCNNGELRICSITGTKTQSGITATVVFTVPKNHIIPNKIRLGGYTLELQSLGKITRNGLYVTATYTYEFKMATTGHAIFKVLNKSVYETLQKYDAISQLTMSLSTPNNPATVFIKLADDLYLQNEGFTPDEILKHFGVNIIYPPFLKYKVTELEVREGTPIISLIHTLFPVPSTINIYPDNVVEVRVKRDDYSSIQLFGCVDSYTHNYNSKDVNIIVTGMLTEPKNIVYTGDEITETKETDENGNEIELKVTNNIFGKRYAVTFEKYTLNQINIPNKEMFESEE